MLDTIKMKICREIISNTDPNYELRDAEQLTTYQYRPQLRIARCRTVNHLPIPIPIKDRAMQNS